MKPYLGTSGKAWNVLAVVVIVGLMVSPFLPRLLGYPPVGNWGCPITISLLMGFMGCLSL